MPASNAVSLPVAVLLLIGMVGPAAPRAVWAQQRAAGLPAAWDAAPLTVPVPSAVRVDRPRRDYRWVGTAVGALTLGIAAALEARAACGNSEHGPRDCTGVTIGVGVLGAAVGGVIGNLVGRAFKRG